VSSPRPRPRPRPDVAPPAPPPPAEAAPPAKSSRAASLGAAAGRVRTAARDNARTQAAARARAEPRFDASSWVGALVVMVVLGAALWVVQIVNAERNYDFLRVGLKPREVGGLWGILTQAFLHASYRDMLSDTLPVVLIGWVLLLAGVRTWLTVTLTVIVVGGALTWLIGPGTTVIVGDSVLVFGWIGYLVARAIFARKIKWILVAIMVLLIFGTLLGGLVPVSHSQNSWQAHLSGFVAGVAIAAFLHPRRGRTPASRRTAVL
jgi:membrane associated rhomboid family serine protease